MSHAELMDRVYRRQTPIYDLTRRLFLPGRDRLLRAVVPGSGQKVLEVGCGTARNLIKLARRHGEARFFGLDVSSEMLARARARLRREGLDGAVTLAQGTAEELSPGVFGLGEGKRFDFVFFSYSLSMMAEPLVALERAAGLLAPGGRLLIADFGDFAGLPGPLGRTLAKWLSLFHVRPRSKEIQARLEALAGGRDVSVEPILRGYAFLASARS